MIAVQLTMEAAVEAELSQELDHLMDEISKYLALSDLIEEMHSADARDRILAYSAPV